MKRNHALLSLAAVLPSALAVCWAFTQADAWGRSGASGGAPAGEATESYAPPAARTSPSTHKRQMLEAEFQGLSLEELLGFMRSPSAEARAAATKTLATPQRAVPALEPFFAAALHDPDPVVRRSAAFGLAASGGAHSGVVPALAGMLDSDDLSTRIGAASALGRYGAAAEQALGKLRAGLASESPLEAMACAGSLGAITGDLGYVDQALLDRLDAEDPQDRQLALNGIARAKGVTALELTRRLDSEGAGASGGANLVSCITAR